MARGNQETMDRNTALLEWYPMVERIAQRAASTYGTPAGVDTEDLTSCGLIGLAEAWERYDPERGVAFEAFAVPRVRGAVIDAIRDSDWVPRKARQKARMTGEPVAVLVSMDERPTTFEGQSQAEQVADTYDDGPGSEIMAAEDRRELLKTLNQLPDRERMIVTLHYFERVPLQHIARSLGVTESRVSQLHTRALKIMRGTLETAEEVVTAA